MKALDLEKGKHYLVKHEGNKRFVRRAFKKCESRFNSILCYVFTSQIDKRVTMEVKDDFIIYHSNGGKTPSREISIPYYDLKEIRECLKVP